YCSSRIKTPDLVSGSYVDVKPAEYVQLVASNCKTARQNCARGIARPVVRSSKSRRRIGGRIVEEHASRGRRLGGCRAPYTIDEGRTRNGEHATSHVVHLIVWQCYRPLGPAVGTGCVTKDMLEVGACEV